MKNPQTTIAPTFLTHIISAIDGVPYLAKFFESKGKMPIFGNNKQQFLQTPTVFPQIVSVETILF